MLKIFRFPGTDASDHIEDVLGLMTSKNPGALKALVLNIKIKHIFGITAILNCYYMVSVFLTIEKQHFKCKKMLGRNAGVLLFLFGAFFNLLVFFNSAQTVIMYFIKQILG